MDEDNDQIAKELLENKIEKAKKQQQYKTLHIKKKGGGYEEQKCARCGNICGKTILFTAWDKKEKKPYAYPVCKKCADILDTRFPCKDEPENDNK